MEHSSQAENPESAKREPTQHKDNTRDLLGAIAKAKAPSAVLLLNNVPGQRRTKPDRPDPPEEGERTA